MSQSFVPDGVHLTADSGKNFINTLLFHAENFFETEVINLEGDTDRGDLDGQQKNFEKNIKKLEKI
jgi:hypothetical protein